MLIAALAVAGALLGGAASPNESELQRAADRLIATSDIPGVITLVEHDGERVVVASGEAEIGGRKARPEDRFWAGSITKSFVATVVMQLVAERKLGLDDRLSELLPGRFRDGGRIRVRNLLNHTSGIPNYMQTDLWQRAFARDGRVVIAPRRLISAAAKLPLEFPPGTRASYSNTNYLVLGEILQRMTGQTVARLLRERIIEPLGLEATTYEAGHLTVGDDQLHGYDLAVHPPVDVSTKALGGPWADGAIVSNAHDLAEFFLALLRGRLVPPRLLAEMETIVPRSHGEGMGLYRLPSPCGRWFYGHTGGTPGYVTFAAGSRDGSDFYVADWNGVSPDAIHAMDDYLDDLLCHH
ncbi:MAG TPA: serine hydrolase domain-containing protein [Gaiellaceae bacterium]